MLDSMTTAPNGQEPEWTVSDRLRKAREHAGLHQDELADAIDVSVRTISRYETGDVTQPRRIVLRQWALACGVSYEWLVGEARPPYPPQPVNADNPRSVLPRPWLNWDEIAELERRVFAVVA